MSLPLVFRDAAQTEFDDAAAWYDTRRRGLGIELVDEVQRILDLIVSQPDRYPVAVGDVREAPVRRFPYCVYYRTKRDRIVVVAVFHTSRNPSIWQERAKDED